MEAQLRTLTLCQVALAASSFLSLGLPESLAQRGTCFSIPKEKLGMFCFTHPITRRSNMESRFLQGEGGRVTEFISMYKQGQSFDEVKKEHPDLTSLAIREKQIKTAMGHHDTPIRMSK